LFIVLSVLRRLYDFLLPICHFIRSHHQSNQLTIILWLYSCAHQDYPWKRLEWRLFMLFSENFEVILDFLTLQDKHNIRTLSVKAKFISTAKHARNPLTNEIYLYIFRQHTYTIGKIYRYKVSILWKDKTLSLVLFLLIYSALSIILEDEQRRVISIWLTIFFKLR
jgi:hypothetical protein